MEPILKKSTSKNIQEIEKTNRILLFCTQYHNKSAKIEIEKDGNFVVKIIIDVEGEMI